MSHPCLSLTTSFVSLWPHRWPDSWVLCTCVYGSTSSFLPCYLQARLCDLAPSLDCPVSCLTSDYSGLMLISNKFLERKTSWHKHTGCETMTLTSRKKVTGCCCKMLEMCAQTCVGSAKNCFMTLLFLILLEGTVLG